MRDSPLRLALMGDLFLAGEYTQWPDDRCAAVFDEMAPVLRHHDVVLANFEGVVCSDRPLSTRTDKIQLAVKPAFLDALDRAGIRTLCLSNNHVLDFGLAAFERMCEAFAKRGIQTFGAGADVQVAGAPLIQNMGGVSVGHIGLSCESTHPAVADASGTPGVLLLQDPEALDRVRRLRQACDVLVVSVHWGDEHIEWPNPYQLRMARELVHAGANVVAGHHAHVFQGFERYQGAVIFHGLGGPTIAALRQRVVWQGIEQDYVFVPERRHRRAVVASVSWAPNKPLQVDLVATWLGEDGQPVPVSIGALRRMSWRLKPWVWHAPGYATFFALHKFWRFRLQPRLRQVTSLRNWRRLLRRYLSAG